MDKWKTIHWCILIRMNDFKYVLVLIFPNLFGRAEFFYCKKWPLNFLLILRPNWHSSVLLTTTQNQLFVRNGWTQRIGPEGLVVLQPGRFKLPNRPCGPVAGTNNLCFSEGATKKVRYIKWSIWPHLYHQNS